MDFPNKSFGSGEEAYRAERNRPTEAGELAGRVDPDTGDYLVFDARGNVAQRIPYLQPKLNERG
ncbi:MAG: hypothetical protein Q7K43_06785, partial [Candidatus Woesearchaeota archaeon]|nr:hypothetical protein [Candidatus Woesearchaeota archaeon]